MATLAVLADVHLDRPFRWAGPEVGRRLRASLRDTFARAVEAAGEAGVDALVLVGDIYEHEHHAPDTGPFLRAQLERLAPVPVLVAAGNHDHLAPTSVWAQQDWPPNVTVFEHEPWQRLELPCGLGVWGISHGRPRGTPNLVRRLRGAGPDDIAAFHGALRSVGAPDAAAHAPFDESDLEAAGVAYALVGHYHTPRDTGLLSYPGNPAPLEFGEEGERGLLLARIEGGGRVTTSRVNMATHEMHDVELDVTGVPSRHDLTEKLGAELAGLEGVVRVTITGELDPAVELHLGELGITPGGVIATVVRAGDIRPGYDLETLARESTVRGEFVRSVLQAGLADEVRDAVLITGLRALDGRTDLEVL